MGDGWRERYPFPNGCLNHAWLGDQPRDGWRVGIPFPNGCLPHACFLACFREGSRTLLVLLLLHITPCLQEIILLLHMTPCLQEIIWIGSSWFLIYVQLLCENYVIGSLQMYGSFHEPRLLDDPNPDCPTRCTDGHRSSGALSCDVPSANIRWLSPVPRRVAHVKKAIVCHCHMR